MAADANLAGKRYRDQPLLTGQRTMEGFYVVRCGVDCSPSFNWAAHLGEKQLLRFREDLAELGYRFQFITLAGFHALNTSMFELSKAYRETGMAGYSALQQREFALQVHGFKAVKHQAFVGTEYFDYIQNTVQQGQSSTVAMAGSTETAQFQH